MSARKSIHGCVAGGLPRRIWVGIRGKTHALDLGDAACEWFSSVDPRATGAVGADRSSLDAMARATTVHVCSACGHESPRWSGQCPGCGEWNTLVEEVRRATSAGSRAGGPKATGREVSPVALGDVAAVEHARLSTGIGELDSVLGGGLVPGSMVLIGGSPGIGKSTLTTMALANMVAAGQSGALRLGGGVC